MALGRVARYKWESVPVTVVKKREFELNMERFKKQALCPCLVTIGLDKFLRSAGGRHRGSDPNFITGEVGPCILTWGEAGAHGNR